MFLLSAFAKGDRIDLSVAERTELRRVIDQIIGTYRAAEAKLTS